MSANVRTVYINDEPDHSNPYRVKQEAAKKRIIPKRSIYSSKKQTAEAENSVSCSDSDDENIFIPGS